MLRVPRLLHHLVQLTCTLLTLLVDAAHFLWLCLHVPTALAAENLFLRKQLALYQERQIKPQRATDATRLALVWLGRWFDWRQALAIVQPETLPAGISRDSGCSGAGSRGLDARRFPRTYKPSSAGWRGRTPRGVRSASPTNCCSSWASACHHVPYASICPSASTLDEGRATTQRWQTFVRNHAQAIVACDFCVVVTATFRLLYVFVVMEHATRRILHTNVTAYPTASWTLQQLREAIPADHTYRFLMHDRDSIFSRQLDQGIRHLGLRVLKTPVRTPQANALCERLIGTLRRECFDFLIPLSANHVRRILREWVPHYNTSRPHMSLGPGMPQPPASLPVPLQAHRHQLPEHLPVVSQPILGGLHHAYALAEKVA